MDPEIVWTTDWRLKLAERLLAAGFKTVESFVAAFPDEAGACRKLGARPIQLQELRVWEAAKLGCVRELARDMLFRKLVESATLESLGIALPAETARQIQLSSFPLFLGMGGGPEVAKRAQAVLDELANREIAEWRPTGPNDPVLRAAFDAAWPEGDARTKPALDPTPLERLVSETRARRERERKKRGGPGAPALDLRVEPPRKMDELANAALAWRAIEPLWDVVDIGHGREKLLSTLGKVSPGQRALFAVHWCESEVTNGGFHQFFYNDTGVLTPEALDGFRRIGANDYAQVIERAMSLFPGSEPPGDRKKRMAALEQIDFERFQPIDDSFFAMLRARDGDLDALRAGYVRAHLSEFFLID